MSVGYSAGYDRQLEMTVSCHSRNIKYEYINTLVL